MTSSSTAGVGGLPSFTLAEAAFIVHALWVPAVSTDGSLSVANELRMRLSEPSNGQWKVDMDPSYWGFDEHRLLAKADALTPAQEADLRERIAAMTEALSEENRSQLWWILERWISEKEDRGSMDFVRSALEDSPMGLRLE